MDFLIIAAFVLLIIGFFNPQASLFWYKKERTRALSAFIYGVLFVVMICLQSTKDKEIAGVNPQPVSANTGPGISATPINKDTPEMLEEERITEKLKLKAAKNWPNDYSTQEYWVNQEVEDYKYMRTIPAGPIKRQADRNWPYDYTTQKYWYDEQILARERLKSH
jgi:hypothetical protein